jgi:outer membrane protein insertion porin family
VTTRGRAGLSVLCAVILLLAVRWGADAQQPPPILIKELTVEGNRRVQEAVILGRVQSKLGGPFNPALLSEDLRAIFGLGFFDDVKMRVEDFEGGVKIVFVVSERPFVRDIDFTGNKKIATTTLQEKIDLKLGSVYNPVDVQRAREKLKEHYEEEGYFEAQITPEVEKFADGDVRVAFIINEGRRITIDRIVIVGNQGLSARDIKKVMVVQEREYFVLRGTVQRQKLEEDIERILALYNDYGFIQARVESHDIAVDRDRARVTITIRVVEGPQYHVDQINITGVTLLPESEIRRQLKFKSGDVFSRSALRESVNSIADLYSTIGRASADITPRTDQVPAAAKVHITLEITEGPVVYVERINISGNLRSEDKILRREVPMVEGDLFTLQKLTRARQRIINLGYFDMVNVTTSPGSDKTKIIVNVEVTEKPTGIFSIGGGYSSADSFVGTIDLTQRNFLGKGYEASLRIRAGALTQQGIISFTDPWLFDRPLSAGFDLYSTMRVFTDYTYASTGAAIRFSHPFAEYWRWHLGYRISRDNIGHLSDNVLSPDLLEQKGTRVTSMVSGSITRDSRDNIQSPSRGGQTGVTLDFAGLGGDSKFVKAVATTSYYKPVWFGHIVSGRLEGGYAFGWGDDGKVPIFERFYLGGPNSLRGWKFRQVSPVDSTGFAVGGTTEVLGNAEYLIPLPFGLRLAGFFDVGNVYPAGSRADLTDLRADVGAGVRWLSPFGPIRLDYGVKLDRRSGEDLGAFQFSVGSAF